MENTLAGLVRRNIVEINELIVLHKDFVALKKQIEGSVKRHCGQSQCTSTNLNLLTLMQRNNDETSLNKVILATIKVIYNETCKMLPMAKNLDNYSRKIETMIDETENLRELDSIIARLN